MVVIAAVRVVLPWSTADCADVYVRFRPLKFLFAMLVPQMPDSDSDKNGATDSLLMDLNWARSTFLTKGGAHQLSYMGHDPMSG